MTEPVEHEYLDYDDEARQVCVVAKEEHFAVFLNRDALIRFRDGMFWLATEFPIGEEIDLWSDECDGFAGTRIGLLEFQLTSDENRAGEWMRQNGQVHFQPVYDRLDVYLSRAEVMEVYRSVMHCTETNPVALLGNIVINLVSNDRFSLSVAVEALH